MKTSTEIKKQLLERCKEQVNIKYETITKIMSSNKKALESETKSSAGDKHETGRAMLQLEMEKASQQFASISLMQEVLHKIEIHKKNEIGKLGSLIYTSQGNYFLAVSIGQITINKENYFVISPSSPIGKLLLGKQKRDNFILNGKEFK
ncbi:MAG: 3-oxoacyl-ACP synthase, partial [Flavobacteriaceae bacterium]|nr:3-oxoacyl-ACP synthase [Flavobacteriaceae bacterium]